MALLQTLLNALRLLSRCRPQQILLALLVLAGLATLAAVGALWIRRRGSADVKGVAVVGMSLLIFFGLCAYWPWRFALVVIVPMAACIGADILKRKGYLDHEGK